nr:hypothetical protein [Tanacetum cinerariifolium]GEX22947.1 hypothetical protein [Tanacetum cinerariifolium]
MAPLLSQRTASVVDMAKAVCFLENHDVRQHPMKVHTSLVLLRSTQSPACKEPTLCILKGPCVTTEITVLAKPATETKEVVLAHNVPETYKNTSLENRAYFDAEAEAIHMILSGIGDAIYSKVDACTTTTEMWEAIERLQQGFYKMMIEMVRNKLEVATMQVNNEVNEIQAEKIARTANSLALIAVAQHYPKYHNLAPKTQKPIAPSSRQITSSKSHATTRNKGKKVVKPVTPPSESTSKEDNDDEHAQKDKNRTIIVVGARETVRNQVIQQTRIQCFNYKGFGHMAKECRKPKRVKDYAYHKEKMMLCKQVEKGVPLSAYQGDWLDDTDEESDEQELEAHYMYMEKI